MSKVITTRLKESEFKKLEEISKKEKLDRSSLVRRLILKGLEEYSIHESALLYQKGIVSLAEAATRAEVSIWEMMEYVETHNIRPPIERKEEILKELEDI